MPVCPSCKEEKPREAFGSRKAPPAKDGSRSTVRRSWCRSCECVREKGKRRTEEQLRHKIRLSRQARSFWTSAQFDEAWTTQEGRCKICDVEMTELKRDSKTAVHADHHPEKNSPRALLCNRCNCGLGFFRDRPDLLRAAAEYLDFHNNRP